MKSSFVLSLFEQFAKEKGFRMDTEAGGGYAACLIARDGIRHYLTTHFDGVNGVGATEVARDKTFSLAFLASYGYAVPQGKAFFSKHYCAFIGSDHGRNKARLYAQELEFPLIVKPNSRSQGRGVWKVYSIDELESAIDDVERWNDIYRVESCLVGRDYRIVIYSNEIICAYERVPLQIEGDGVATVHDLVGAKQCEWQSLGREITFESIKVRLNAMLQRNGIGLETVLEKGKTLLLLGNANLSSGGSARDCTDSLHVSYRQAATAIACAMGLRFCGIDILTDGDGVFEMPFTILELNAGPGLAHYASLGGEQYKRVERLYRRIFDDITSPQV